MYYRDGKVSAAPRIPHTINPSAETIAAHGWMDLVEEQPTYDSTTQTIIPGAVRVQDGIAYRTWAVEPLVDLPEY